MFMTVQRGSTMKTMPAPYRFRRASFCTLLSIENLKGCRMRRQMLLWACFILFLSAPLFAQKARKAAQDGEKVIAVFTQEVKDYTAWRKVYDEKVQNRKHARVKVIGIYTDAKNPNMVTVIAQFPNEALVDSLTSNPKYKSALDDAGVVSSPEVKVLRQMAPQ
jgi:hypothetical protein